MKNITRNGLIALSLLFCSLNAITVTDLTTEELVGQLLMVNVQAEEANDAARTLINDLHVGGIIYYTWANGLHSADQVAKLSTELQNLAAQTRTQLPLIIAIDHEGGRVHRFESGLTKFPPAFAYGIINNATLTKQCAKAMGNELRAVGITMNLAPVTDVMSNPNNPIIGTRSFGTTPETVIIHAGAFIEGLHDAGIATSIKHFPGHGDTATDSHVALSTINKSIEELRACELKPFYALADKTDSIMSAHLLIPALDKNTCSTLSPQTLKLLREEANFDGVIITDSLVMKGVMGYAHDDLAQAAQKAFEAGCDILLIGGRCLVGSVTHESDINDVANVHRTLVSAVNNGTIKRKRVEESVARIFALKNHYVLPAPFTPTERALILDTPEHHLLAFTAAQKAHAVLNSSNATYGLTNTVRETFSKQISAIEELYHENASNTYHR